MIDIHHQIQTNLEGGYSAIFRTTCHKKMQGIEYSQTQTASKFEGQSPVVKKRSQN